MDIHQPGQHLDSLLRITRSHHSQLSTMADSKANMMLTVASLLVPLSVGFMNKPPFHWAAITLIGFSILTVILAAYAAMPKLTPKIESDAPVDIESPIFNILFFGSFCGMSYDRYRQEMETVLNDHNRVYEVQVREIYLLGHYLARQKYRYLRLAYLSFISGLTISALVCMICVLD